MKEANKNQYILFTILWANQIYKMIAWIVWEVEGNGEDMILFVHT